MEGRLPGSRWDDGARWGFPLPPRSGEVPEKRGNTVSRGCRSPRCRRNSPRRRARARSSQVTHPDAIVRWRFHRDASSGSKGLSRLPSPHSRRVRATANDQRLWRGGFEDEIDLVHKRAVERTGRCDEDLATPAFRALDGYDLPELPRLRIRPRGLTRWSMAPLPREVLREPSTMRSWLLSAERMAPQRRARRVDARHGRHAVGVAVARG